jgi:uncharacterized membrane protein YdjX (TVP38/TMEM64 family)
LWRELIYKDLYAMPCIKRLALLLLFICSLLAIVSLHLVNGLERDQIQLMLERAGVWAPLLYVILYVALTVFLLPSTPLNLAGGFIFGPWLGTFWTTIGALIAAIFSFIFARTVGYKIVEKKLAGYWQRVDAEIQGGGIPYIFAIRLLPIVPYGLFNFAAGLTSVSFKDYIVGTVLGTAPGVFPFVMLGGSTQTMLTRSSIYPLLIALSLISILVIAATWYRRHSRFS